MSPDSDKNQMVVVKKTDLADLTREELEDLVMELFAQIQKAEGQADGLIADLENTSDNLDSTRGHLLQAAKMADLGILLASVGHEIRNPLALVMMGVDVLKSSRSDWNEESLLMLKRIQAATQRMKGLVDHLGVFGRDSDAEEFVPIDLKEVLSDSMIFLNHELRVAEIDVEISFPKGLSNVLGNRTQLESVFHNLISNSRDAFRNCNFSSKKIQIDCIKLASKIQLTYRDNAGGMPQDFVDRMWDPFTTTKKAGEGTGLGMSIVKNILDDHEATVHVASKSGVGTVFTIEFPAL